MITISQSEGIAKSFAYKIQHDLLRAIGFNLLHPDNADFLFVLGQHLRQGLTTLRVLLEQVESVALVGLAGDGFRCGADVDLGRQQNSARAATVENEVAVAHVDRRRRRKAAANAKYFSVKTQSISCHE